MGGARGPRLTTQLGAEAPPPALECTGLSVDFGRHRVLSDVNLSVASGQVLAVLGPSGSGKTTLLHTIAGFVQPAAGEVRLGGRPMASPAAMVPPERRGVGMVFQNYALWPHLSALDTVAYPIRRSGLAVSEARERAAEMLARLGLAHLAARRPSQLSGGEQQRVGLARALARAAQLYIFDEPTAHLDAWLRERFQEEMAERCRQTGAAAIYATHDAAEALAVSDQVVLLRDGAVAQGGTPVEIYEQPQSLWAARLTGPASLLRVEVNVRGERRFAVIAGVECPVDGPAPDVGGAATLVVRPGWALIGGPMKGVIEQVWYRGAHTDHRLQTDAGCVLVRQPGPPTSHAGDEVSWRLERSWLVEELETRGPGTLPERA